MATILDVSLLQTFDIVYPVLLVLVVMFALLQKTKAIGDNVGINVRGVGKKDIARGDVICEAANPIPVVEDLHQKNTRSTTSND